MRLVTWLILFFALVLKATCFLATKDETNGEDDDVTILIRVLLTSQGGATVKWRLIPRIAQQKPEQRASKDGRATLVSLLMTEECVHIRKRSVPFRRRFSRQRQGVRKKAEESGAPMQLPPLYSTLFGEPKVAPFKPGRYRRIADRKDFNIDFFGPSGCTGGAIVPSFLWPGEPLCVSPVSHDSRVCKKWADDIIEPALPGYQKCLELVYWHYNDTFFGRFRKGLGRISALLSGQWSAWQRRVKKLFERRCRGDAAGD